MRVVAALSGGVDSAVAAARMAAEGHEVVGVHLALSQVPSATRAGSRGCCSAADARDARRVADLLGIPYYVWDVSADFERDVVGDFLATYASGQTPNPCMRCNERIKFATVLDRALDMGFDALATGHYARLEKGPRGSVLRRAVDADKDQSYVLASLTQRQLEHAVFPVGDSPKAQVRSEAQAIGLAVADKPDSTDLCFVADGDTAGYLRERLGHAPGPILDEEGVVLGQHDGAYAFTVGQRRGLALDGPSPDGRPRYVLSIQPAARSVTVGTAEALQVAHLVAERPVWGVEAPREAFVASAQVRAHGAAVDVVVGDDREAMRVRFGSPQRGVAPGQSVVLYHDDRVWGAGVVARTEPAHGLSSTESVLA